MSLVDWRGKLIEPGTTIVYPTGSSSNIAVVEAIVARIDSVPATTYVYTIDPATRQRVQHTATVHNPVLYVRRMKERWYSSTHKVDSTRLQKITQVGRVTVVEPADINLCNFEGCIADVDHDDPGNPDYYPAHSFERDE